MSEKTTGMNSDKRLVSPVIAVILFALAACSTMEAGNGAFSQSPPLIRNFLSGNSARINNARQIIFVTNTDPSAPLADIYALESEGAEWRIVFGPIKGNIGRNGFAAVGLKREGDGRTPSGIFALDTAFGYLPAIVTRMPYRQAGADDFWVDDVDSPHYNRWGKGDTGASSVEKMKREDDLYKYGIVIEYNTNPVVKGQGSAIFFHVWRGEGRPTAGCVSLPEEMMVKMLSWLDPAKRPLTVMGTENELSGLE